jgi:hypothetical protein
VGKREGRDNIKMGLQEIGLGGRALRGWIDIQDRDKWGGGAHVNAVMNLRVP